MASGNGQANGATGMTPQAMTDAMKAGPLIELGRTGLKQYGGWVIDEFRPELQLDQGRRLYREMMDNDNVIGGILFAIEMLIRQVVWHSQPADETPEALAAAEFLDQCLEDMSTTFPNTLASALTMLGFGWSWLEIVYKKRDGYHPDDPTRDSQFTDGKIGWRKWAERSQEALHHWEFDKDSGELVGMWQQPPPDYSLKFIPLKKSLHFTTTLRKGNPEGRSILRNAYTSWYYKSNIQRIEAIGMERDLAGLPVATVPAEWTLPTSQFSSQYTAIKQLVTNIRRDEQEGVVLPMMYDANGHPLVALTLLSAGGRRQFDTSQIIGRYDAAIAMSVMADFLMLGHEAVGTKELSSDKTDLFQVAITAWLDSLEADTNKQAVAPLMRLNGFPQEVYPTLKHGDLEGANVLELANALKLLADAGFPLFPNIALQKHVLELMNLPVPADVEGDAAGPAIDAEGEINDIDIEDNGPDTGQSTTAPGQPPGTTPNGNPTDANGPFDPNNIPAPVGA